MFCIPKSVVRNSNVGKLKTFFFSSLFISFILFSCSHQQIADNNDSSRKPAYSKILDSFQRYAFEQCSASSRLYLEDDILKMPQEYFLPHDEDWSQKIPISCIQFAQRNFSGHYASCITESSRPTTDALKPCMTENYVRLTYNAYHDVMDCFNLNPKDFFLQIFIESGFHVNAINKGGFDSGMAQFTASGIKKVTANNLVIRTQEILLGSSRPSCSRISSVVKTLDSDAFEVKNRCSMISLPSNPYRAMLMNYLHTMLDQIAISKLISETKPLQAVVTDKIKRHLIYLAYNRGIMGTNDLLNGYILSRKKVNHTLVSEDFELDKNLADVKAILNQDAGKRKQLRTAKKIRNLTFAEYAVINGASYVSDMKAAHDQVQRYFSDQCGGL